MLIIFDPDFKPFATSQDFSKNYCRPFSKWFSVVKDYKNCLDSFKKTLYTSITNNVRKTHRKYCSDQEGVKTAFSHLKCITGETLTPVKYLAKQFQSFLMAVSTTSDKEDKKDNEKLIQSLCCGSRIMKERAVSSLTDICSSRTGNKQSGTFLTDIVYGVFSEIIDLTCAKYPSVEKCKQLTPEVTRQMQRVMDNPIISQDSSIMTSIINILYSLDE
jgi:hypothetical protein